jgi:hypothetical protein
MLISPLISPSPGGLDVYERGQALAFENRDVLAGTELAHPGQGVERESGQHHQALQPTFVVFVEVAAVGLVRKLQ